jgi:hypothetical protein
MLSKVDKANCSSRVPGQNWKGKIQNKVTIPVNVVTLFAKLSMAVEGNKLMLPQSSE